jgi:hypothetical protein
MSTGTTALMPLDPAVSPEQANRILTIRTNLLPDEIRAGRNARRIRFFLIVAVVLAVVVMGGWYLYAVKQRNMALDDSNSTDRQVADVRNKINQKKYSDVQKDIDNTKSLNDDLKSTLARDLPWDTLLNQIRGTATTKSVTISAIVGTLAEQDKSTSGTASSSVTGIIGTLQISGRAKDKKTIADFVDAIATMTAPGGPAVTNAYLTSATEQSQSTEDPTRNWIFTMTASITAKAECGRFTGQCQDGGY